MERNDICINLGMKLKVYHSHIIIQLIIIIHLHSSEKSPLSIYKYGLFPNVQTQDVFIKGGLSLIVNHINTVRKNPAMAILKV